jgi:hypothetical protein
VSASNFNRERTGAVMAKRPRQLTESLRMPSSPESMTEKPMEQKSHGAGKRHLHPPRRSCQFL